MLFSGVFSYRTFTVSGTSPISGTATNFAALPSAASYTDKFYAVTNAQGTVFINRKDAGVYRSDGVNWIYVADLTAYDQASEIQNDSSVSGATVKDALDTITNSGAVSGTEFGYLDGVTSAIQTQINAKASTTQTFDIQGFIEVPTNKDFKIVINSTFGFTINEVTTRSTAGTITCTGKINTTALGGTANSVSSTETTQTHSSANTVVAGDDVVLTLSSNSSCVNMSFKIKGTRTLA